MHRTPPKKRRTRRSYDGRKLYWLHTGRNILVLAAVFLLLFRFVLGFATVSGVSMQDTLNHGELVFYTRINGDIKRGEIVAVHLPEDSFWVKRVIAVGGDTVDLINGVIYVNGIEEQADYVRGITLP